MAAATFSKSFDFQKFSAFQKIFGLLLVVRIKVLKLIGKSLNLASPTLQVL